MVNPVDRIVPHVPIQVQPVPIADRIGLHEPPQVGVVEAVAVVLDAPGGRDRQLAGVLQVLAVAGAGPAVFVIGVDDGRRA